MFYFLAKHPEVQERVFQEVEAVLNGGKKELEAEDVKKLK